MEISSALKQNAKSRGVAWEYLVMADLITLGYSEADSYAIAYGVSNAVLSDMQNRNVRKQVTTSPKFKELLKKRHDEIASTRLIDPDDKLELIGAEETAREILTVAMGMPEKSKERGEMFMRYADLIRKNDTTTKDDEDPVVIYLPQKCSMCRYKKEYESTHPSAPSSPQDV